MAAPLMLLDVDGVLAPLGQPEPGEDVAWVEVDVAWVEVIAGRYWVRPDVLRALEDLVTATGAEVLWLTSWYGDAPEHLAPAVGLPAWGFVTKADAVARCGWRSGMGWWKESVVLRVLGEGREVIWIDDEIEDESFLSKMPGAYPGLTCVCPDSERGLTLGELAGVRERVRSG